MDQSSELPSLPYFENVERKGKLILDYFASKKNTVEVIYDEKLQKFIKNCD